MKKYFILLAVFGFLLSLISPKELSAAQNKPYYLLFDNIESQMGNGVGTGMPTTNTKITNLIDLLYWDPITRKERYFYLNALRTQFGPAAYADYDATHYDFTIFPMGNNGLTHTVGGVKVIDKINEIVAAGKDLIIIGSDIFRKSLTDPTSKKFFEETLGIDINVQLLNLMDGNTIVPFAVDTDSEDRISGGIRLFCNSWTTAGDGSEIKPTRYYPDLEVFKPKSGSKLIPFAWVTVNQVKYNVGARIQVGNSKIVFWSLDWAAIRGDYIGNAQFSYYNSFDWFVEDEPFPNAYFDMKLSKYDLGSCEVGDSLFQIINLRNFGREPLNLGDIVFSAEDIPFQIVEKPKNKTIAPNETFKLKIKFSPKEEGEYMESIYVYSDAMNTSKGRNVINLEAVGGKKVNYGPMISITSYPLDFGKIAIGQSGFADVEVTNTGTANLIVDSVTFLDKKQKDFVYGETYKMPQVVIPGNTYTLRVKFVPLEEGKKYSTIMGIGTNGLNNIGWGFGIGRITLQGESKSSKPGPDSYVSVGDELKFDSVAVGLKKDVAIQVRNVGGSTLEYLGYAHVDSNEFKGDKYKEVFTVSPAGYQKIEPGDSAYLNVTFKPSTGQEIYGYMYILTNSTNPSKKKYEVWLNGQGFFDADVNETAVISNFNLFPNPVKNNANLLVKLNKYDVNNLKILLVDYTGRNIINFIEGAYPKGEQNFDLDFSSIPSGKYILVISNNKIQENLPVIIE